MSARLQFNTERILCLFIGFTGLAVAYGFQDRFNFEAIVPQIHPFANFALKKTVRVLLNDTSMLLLIYAWFYENEILKIAWWLQLIDTLILLPLYLVFKLWLEGDAEISSPLLSQFHRLIVNPTIMILLIPAIYFQRMRVKQTKE